MNGLITNIQRCSNHDGPGLRTTVFFAGCTLNCFWCHNPEAVTTKPALLFREEGCITCMRCVSVCTRSVHQINSDIHMLNRVSCVACGACVEVCPASVLSLSARNYTVNEVMQHLLRDKPYYLSTNGGITLSGGEPLFWPEFTLALLKRCKKESLHTAVDTAGNVDFSDISMILPFTDLFLYDIKAITEELHRCGTGVSNRRILQNLRSLLERGAIVRVRVPVIPDFNDTTEEQESIANFLASMHKTYPSQMEEVTLLPFHTLGVSKYHLLGLSYSAATLTPPNDAQMEQFREIFYQRGLPL